MATTDGPGCFGVLLQQYRAAAGLSQEELAERAGLSRRGISDLERGERRSPHPATVRRLADALGLEGAERTRLLARVHTPTPSRTTIASSIESVESSTPPRAPGSTAIPLVGRRAEWNHLLRAWQAASAGAPGMAVIGGEAGIGKTRLAEELLAWARRQGAGTAQTRAYAAEGWLSYGPVTDWLRSDTLREVVVRLDPRARSDVAHLLPELVPNRSDAPREHELAEPQRRQQFFRSLARATLSAAPPLLLLLDDLQWCDQDTLEWLHYLLRFDSRAALLVVGTVRTDEMGPGHPLGPLLTDLRRTAQLTEVALGPLDASETAALALCVAGQGLDPEEIRRVYEQTEGQPLFVVETIRARLGVGDEAGRASLSATPSSPSGGTATGQLPAKVHAVIAARLGQLSDSARETVRLAATIGRSFTLDLLMAASTVELDSLVPPLDELRDRQIVREQGLAAYDFTHDKIREVAYGDMSAARRSMLHRRVAQALERISGGNLESLSAQVAAHYAQGGLPAQALPYYQRAAELAQRVYAHAEASQLLTKGLVLLTSLSPGHARDAQELAMQTALGISLVATRGYGAAEVMTAYRRARQLCQKLGERPGFPVLRTLAIVSIAHGDFDQAHDLGDQLLSLATLTTDPMLLVEAQYVLGVALFWKGALARSRWHLEQALARCPSTPATAHLNMFAQDPRVVCLSRLAMDLWLLGYAAQADRMMAEALRTARELSHPFSLGYAQLFAMIVATQQQDVGATARHAEACLALSREHGMGLWLSIAMIFQGWARSEQGDVTAGLVEMRRGIRAFRASGNVYIAPFFLGLLAQQCARVGRLERALSLLAAALMAVARTGERWYAAELYRARGMLLVARGDEVGAEADFLRAVEIAQEQQARAFELRVAIDLARLWQRQNKRAEARQVLEASCAWFGAEGRNTPEMAEAQSILAGIAAVSR